MSRLSHCLESHLSDALAPSREPKTPQRGVPLWLVLATVATLGCGTARATDFSIGVGAGASRGKVDCLAAFPCDRSDTSFKLFAGYQVTPEVDARLSYFGGDSFKGADVTPLGTQFGGTFKVSGLGLTAGYLWRFAPAWSLHGRLGVASVRTRFDYADPFSGSASKTTTQPTGGLALGYDFTPAVRVGLDLDVTRFKAHNTNGSLQTLGLVAQYAF
jgi:predicted porin